MLLLGQIRVPERSTSVADNQRPPPQRRDANKQKAATFRARIPPATINSPRPAPSSQATGDRSMQPLDDNLQKELDEAFLALQLHKEATHLFEDDPQTSAGLREHLIETAAAPIADKLISALVKVKDDKAKSGVEVGQSGKPDAALANFEDRVSLVRNLAKNLPGSVSDKAQALVEALEGKRLDAFMTTLKEIAKECGLPLRELDKELERTMLHSYEKDLTAQISTETDPVALLPKVVALLYLKVFGKALQALVQIISAAVSQLKDKLPDSATKSLMDYQKATLTLLALQAAWTGDEEDCTWDRILTKKELLEEETPGLKNLALNFDSSSS